MPDKSPNNATPQTLNTGTENAALEYDVAKLMDGRTEIILRYNNMTYRLKATRQGKLILNK